MKRLLILTSLLLAGLLFFAACGDDWLDNGPTVYLENITVDGSGAGSVSGIARGQVYKVYVSVDSPAESALQEAVLSNGQWSFALSGLSQGVHTIYAVAASGSDYGAMKSWSFQLTASGYVQNFDVPDDGGSSSSTAPNVFAAYSGSALAVVAFQPSYSAGTADGGGTWFDIYVANPAALGSWTLKSANDSYVNTQFSSSGLSVTVEQGDVIRVHGSGWTGTADSSKSDNNSGVWDVKTVSDYDINWKHGAIWIEDGSGNVIDGVIYVTENNDSGVWMDSNADTALQSIVSANQWTAATLNDAYSFTTSSGYAVLSSFNSDGNSKADWTTASTNLPYLDDGSSASSSSGTSSSSASSYSINPGDVLEKNTSLPSSVQTYYSSAYGLNGGSLYTELHNIIDGHTDRGYDGLYTIYQDSDITSDGKVWDIYSANDATGLDRPYTFNWSDNCGNYSSEGDCFNREHVIPQSKFDSRYPMRSDAHHVIPTDGKVNGMRSSYPHGNVSSPSKTSQNGSMLGSCSDAGYSGTVFEPIDVYKGDVARMYFYFAVRYKDNGNCMSWDAMASGAYLKSWLIPVLLQWHLDDPVDQKEIDRNNAIGLSIHQGNRNPFIDYPEAALLIWGTPSSPVTY